ncbi:MAG: hypothetical protein PHD18_04075 [Tolumonas sp.]|nr:hypothetical protein [Tolumonas sp.]
MNKIRKCLLSCGLLLLPSLASAEPVAEFVDTLFIGGGVMLFLAGVLLLLVPGLFKTGVLTTLLADILFMARMLFPDALEQSIAAQPDWQPLIESASIGSGRVYAAVGVAIIVVSILSLRWLLHSFFAPSTTPQKTPRANRASTPDRATTKPSRNKTRLNRDRDDFSGYTEEPPAARPEPPSPLQNKRFRVHDYLENLEHQQAQPAPPRQQDAEPVIHFDRIER